MTRPLGQTQQDVLAALRRHRMWYPGMGWVWENRSTTIRILDSLVKRGLVSKRGGAYYPTEVQS